MPGESGYKTLRQRTPIVFPKLSNFDQQKWFIMSDEFQEEQKNKEYGPSIGHHLGKRVPEWSFIQYRHMSKHVFQWILLLQTIDYSTIENGMECNIIQLNLQTSKPGALEWHFSKLCTILATIYAKLIWIVNMWSAKNKTIVNNFAK